MRTLLSLAGVLLLCACHGPVRTFSARAADAPKPAEAEAEAEAASGTVTVAAPTAPKPVLMTFGKGAAPGNTKGPGGFVSRGRARNFYAAGGGRLWYYLNNYHWAPESAPRDDLWIKAEVTEEFRDLKTWPDGAAPARRPRAKTTVEYWEVAPKGRSVRLDNHKDFCLLSENYTAGAITVELTLTLGHLEVRDDEGRWGRSKEAYVLEARNYSGGGGIGADRARFTALQTEAVNVWGYRIPWDVHPQRMTRSSWQRLRVPTWKLLEVRPPPTPQQTR